MNTRFTNTITNIRIHTSTAVTAIRIPMLTAPLIHTLILTRMPQHLHLKRHWHFLNICSITTDITPKSFTISVTALTM